MELIKSHLFLQAFSSVQFSSVAQSCPILCSPMDCSMSDLPVHHQLPEFTDSCPLSWWCHPTISSSVVSSSCLQSFPASESFSMSQMFASGDQSIGASASTSALPMNTQDWAPLGWTWSPRESQESPPTLQFKSINSSVLSFLYSSTLTPIHDHWKNHSLD